MPLHGELYDMEHGRDDERCDEGQDGDSALEHAAMVQGRLRGQGLDVGMHGHNDLLAGLEAAWKFSRRFCLEGNCNAHVAGKALAISS